MSQTWECTRNNSTQRQKKNDLWGGAKAIERVKALVTQA